MRRSIDDQPFGPDDLPQGCPFHPRCPLAHDACLPVEPALRSYGVERSAACVLV